MVTQPHAPSRTWLSAHLDRVLISVGALGIVAAIIVALLNL